MYDFSFHDHLIFLLFCKFLANIQIALQIWDIGGQVSCGVTMSYRTHFL